MSRRKENVRKSCDEIKRLIMETWKEIVNMRDSIEYNRFVELAVKTSSIKRLTHRIKRTTWRGKEEKKQVIDYNSVGINLPRSAYRNPDV